MNAPPTMNPKLAFKNLTACALFIEVICILHFYSLCVLGGLPNGGDRMVAVAGRTFEALGQQNLSPHACLGVLP